MKVYYIGHSGFLVETSDFYYIFDYFKGTVPTLKKDKPVFVFSSHAHHDHYNKEIFEILKKQNVNVKAVLSKDISEKNYPEGVEVLKVYANKEYLLDGKVKIETLQSTDVGVAFLVHDSGGTIYHAGDLNDWVWDGNTEQKNKQMTGSYRHEIDKLKGKQIDLAFVVLDPRQEKDYARGMLYFIKQNKCGCIYPMHYWEKPQIIDKFLNEYPQYSAIIKNTEQSKGE